MSPTLQFVFARIFPWPFAIAGALMLFFGTRSLIRAHESMHWPTTPRVIQNSSVEYRSGNKGGAYHAHILYNYNLNGTAFSGDRVAYGDYGSSDSSHAQEIVNHYPVGANVTVYYIQSIPEECLLEPGIKMQALVIPGVGLFFFLAGVLMLVFLPGVIRKACEPIFDSAN